MHISIPVNRRILPYLLPTIKKFICCCLCIAESTAEFCHTITAGAETQGQ